MPLALVRALRPRQWVKNFLVLAAPLFSGRIGEGDVLGAALASFGCFCLTASAVYLFNDVRDVDEDRLHPRKQRRPIAAGLVSEPTALVVAVVLGVVGLGVAALVSLPLLGVLAAYLVVNVAYSTVLRHEPVLDLAAIASGFVLRAVAGSAAAGIELSQWFLLIATFGALFVAAGKRFADLQAADPTQPGRRSLAGYTSTYLRFVWSTAAGALIMSYALWAFEIGASQTGGVRWSEVSIAPFLLAVLRYAVDVDAARASEPEDIAFTDRLLLGLAALWLGCVVLAVYTG